MESTSYRDAAEVGVPLIVKTDEAFYPLVEAMTARELFWGSWPEALPERAAVLCNSSGKKIMLLSWVWRYRNADGTTHTRRNTNSGSSIQLQMLTRTTITGQSSSTFIAPGSRRLITEEQMYGDNFDVLPVPDHPGGHGFATGGAGRVSQEQPAEAELVLDVVLFEDGLLAGPDEAGMGDSLIADLRRLPSIAAEAGRMLHNGGTEGNVFDLLLPFLREQRSQPSPAGPRVSAGLMSMFAQMSIGQMTGFPREHVIRWFAEFANASPVPIHRHANAPY